MQVRVLTTRYGSVITGVRISPSAAYSAVMNKQIEKTQDFMFCGARAYAISYEVTLTRISEMAPRHTMGSSVHTEIGLTPVSHVDALYPHGLVLYTYS